MRDMTTTSKNSMAATAAATNMSGRQFELPKIELPANLRELAKEVMARTRGNYEQIETAANETMRVLVSMQSTAAKSILDYRAWLMASRRTNRRSSSVRSASLCRPEISRRNRALNAAAVRLTI